jgi:AcrR family transcriptional regulator
MTTSRVTEPSRPRESRRSPTAHKAIINATLELLRTVRYSNLTMEAIGAKAGVGKATVYRWWPSKGALVAEAIATKLQIEDPPQTDDFRADLIEAVKISTANYARPPGGVLVTALAADLTHDEALLASFLEKFVLPRRRVVTDLVERGVREGHLAADTDPELLMDMIAGAIMYRTLMKHQPIKDDLVMRLVDTLMPQQPIPKKRAVSR